MLKSVQLPKNTLNLFNQIVICKNPQKLFIKHKALKMSSWSLKEAAFIDESEAHKYSISSMSRKALVCHGRI